jgi:FtsP/CotA-like multicopper oxidase with cupredoxin domain
MGADLVIRRCAFALLMVFVTASSRASATPSKHPIAQANDNQRAGGNLKSGVLTLQLEILETTWYPERDDGPSVSVYAFAEKGKAPQIPGPLLRISEGTEVRAQIHNALPVAMFIRGLHSHTDSRSEPVLIASGASADFHFTVQSPGTYYYSARSTKMSIEKIGLLSIVDDLPMGQPPFDIESELAGGFIVDPPGVAPNDRIFLITNWIAGVITPPFREEVVINGKAWPHTERISYRVGDTARWRLLNASINDHAMHLHGFFFEVTSLGNQDRDRPNSADQIPHVVTQHLDPGQTTSIRWTPDRPGNWLLHCHMAAHMMKQEGLEQPGDSHLAHDADHDSGGVAGMGGMVLGITVSGASSAAVPPFGVNPRKLQMIVRETPATRFSLAHMGYVLLEPGAKETTDPPPFPGAPIVLTRGETAEITIVNQLKEPTAVHWHGIELESYNDGVPGWSGNSPQITPPIPPGGTFVARMTPPRAGTFIYHTHWHDVAQLTSGLYGPLIVLEPGQKFDPDVDKIFIVGRQGPRESVSPLLLNGTAQPSPLVLKLGTKYRLRFINMGVNDSDASVAVLDENAKPIQWRAISKDGWALAPAQATMRPSTQPITVGETYDFELVPDRPGEFTLQVRVRFLKTSISQSVTVR